MENYVSPLFLQFLSSLHNMMLTDRDLVRLSRPNTTSYLYNYSLELNQSSNPIDLFKCWGYPSDTFALHFLHDKPGLSIMLQLVIVTLLLSFIVMAGVLVWVNCWQGGNRDR